MIDPRTRRPDEGWLTLGLVALLIAVLALAVDDPSWVNGRGHLTDGLLLLGMLGVAVGFIGPKVGWGRWTTHGIGALFGGLLIPIVAGWAEYPGHSVGETFIKTASGSINAYLDLAWRGREFTVQEVHYIVVLGIVIWATGQFAAYAVFGHRRPLNAVIVTGIILLANMSMTFKAELPYLVLFTGASLFLLIQMHAFDERATWLRRRIGDPSTISSLYLRGGTVFILAAMLGSLVLTARAASNPLAGAWGPVHDQLIEVGESLSKYLPVGGDANGNGVTFGSSAKIAGKWFTDDGIAFTATLPTTEKTANLYWRAATFDTFVYSFWEQTGTHEVDVPAGGDLLAGSAESPDPDITRTVKVTVNPRDFRGNEILAPGAPTTVDHDASMVLSGNFGWFGRGEVPVGQVYTVSAQVLELNKPKKISKNLIEAVPQIYPAEISELYTDVPEGALGPDAEALLARVKANAKTPVRARQRDRQGPGQQGRVHLRHQCHRPDLRQREPGRVLRALQARLLPPLRIDDGDADASRVPGEPDPDAAGRGVPARQAGRQRRDRREPRRARLGGGLLPGLRLDPVRSDRSRRRPREPDPDRSRRAAPGRAALVRHRRPRRGHPGHRGAGRVATSSNRSTPGDRTLFVVLSVVLVLLVGGIALAAWLRGPRGEISPDGAWASLSKAASRLGYGRRANQTVYEYATSLGELVPVARADLATVADAKVETSYARARLGGDRLEAVGRATRRLRVSLLRLAFRRGRRSRKPKALR